jgi:hypothetical protein
MKRRTTGRDWLAVVALWLVTFGLFAINDTLLMHGMGATAGAAQWAGVVLFFLTALVTWRTLAYSD